VTQATINVIAVKQAKTDATHAKLRSVGPLPDGHVSLEDQRQARFAAVQLALLDIVLNGDDTNSQRCKKRKTN
jgi:hypothetical protein